VWRFLYENATRLPWLQDAGTEEPVFGALQEARSMKAAFVRQILAEGLMLRGRRGVLVMEETTVDVRPEFLKPKGSCVDSNVLCPLRCCISNGA
jgi:hypothetical protein